LTVAWHGMVYDSAIPQIPSDVEFHSLEYRIGASRLDRLNHMNHTNYIGTYTFPIVMRSVEN
jgi:hypothetical protein